MCWARGTVSSSRLEDQCVHARSSCLFMVCRLTHPNQLRRCWRSLLGLGVVTWVGNGA